MQLPWGGGHLALRCATQSDPPCTSPREEAHTVLSSGGLAHPHVVSAGPARACSHARPEWSVISFSAYAPELG